MAEKQDSDAKEKHARSPSPDVKSTAVVKYTSVKCPVGFAKLQCNTDLKLPPSNWLSSATDSYGLRHALSHSAGFSSFRMAHMFPDCVGEVDVVSGAECIKSLLKLPYHPNGVVSMIVHRVENSLLLDDFDVYQYLMKSEWSWMKKFFYENFLKSISSEDRVMYMKNKSRYALQQKSLISKFLYHSLPSFKGNDCKDDDNKELQLPTIPLSGPLLPEPDLQKTIPHPNFSNHTYNRNVVWTFEDIQMLIGSDMPIFGGIDRPCVSLRLQEASEPINVLTGIDYWLDNLMCNVPEVIMCYHLDGIVRKYEPIKTEDLPNLKDSKFSPKVIRNVAQNILSFLKSNATKAGHTYWLFKGTNDDVVKLYDLTTLCGSAGNSSDQNPFTIPVAMLLYRVARNMKTPCQAGHIKMLLENCIKLLPKERFPHIVASSHFMLANLYIPANTDPGAPNLKGSSSGECECGDPKTCRRREGYEDESLSNDVPFNKKRPDNVFEDVNFSNMVNSPKFTEDPKSSNTTGKTSRLKKEKLISDNVAVNSLTVPRNSLSAPSEPPPTVGGKLEDRCLTAIKHVEEGFSALNFFNIFDTKEDNTKRNSSENRKESDNPKMACSFEPIPMGYESLHPQEKRKMAQSNIPIPMPYKDDEIDTESENVASEIEPSKNERSSRRRKRDSKNKKKTSCSQNKTNMDEIENARQKLDGIVLRKGSPMASWKEPISNDDASWKAHLKSLLYEKASLACATLSEQYYTNSQYGLSFKYIIIALKCQNVLDTVLNCNGRVDDCFMLERVGDILFQFAKHWDKYESSYKQQLDKLSEIESHIVTQSYKDIDLDMKNKKKDLNSEIKIPNDLESTIATSGEYYEKALKIAPKERKEGLMRRMASVKNELGVKFMYDAQEQYTLYCNKKDKDDLKDGEVPLYETLSRKSFSYLMESAKIFEQVNDLPNLALLHCNTGRFMRFKAHCNQKNHSPEQKKFYASAIDHYGRALRLLAGENCEGVRDLVKWELSSALFTQACLMQDSPPNIPDAAAEAAEALRLALRSCSLIEGPRQCLYQFRAGVLHHRLASLYHNIYRDTSLDTPKLKAAATLSKLNYEHAVTFFLPLEDTIMFLTVQMEHVALMEYQANNATGLKLKMLQNALELLQQCEPVLKLIYEKEPSFTEIDDTSSDSNSTDKANTEKHSNFNSPESKLTKSSEDDIKAEFKLLTLFEQRLQFVLKNLIQVCLVKNNAWKKDNEKLLTFYKSSYSLVLKLEKFEQDCCRMYAEHLYNTLLKVKDFARNNEL